MGFRFGIWRCDQRGLWRAATSQCLLPRQCIHEIPKHQDVGCYEYYEY